MRHSDVWQERYRGVGVKVCKGESVLGWKDSWTFYLYLRLDQIEDAEKREAAWLPLEEPGLIGGRRYWRYSDSWLADLDFHCGMTYYSKSLSDRVAGDAESRVIEIGCDYQHLWDEHRTYTADEVMANARKCVDSLHALTTYLVFANCCGRLIRESDGWECGDSFYPNSCECGHCPKKSEEGGQLKK